MWWILLILAGAIAGGSSEAQPPGSPDCPNCPARPEVDWEPPEVEAGGYALLQEYAVAAQLTEEQFQFLVFTAYGESRLNPYVGLGNPELFPSNIKANTYAGEANAARRAYQRNAETFADCGHDPLTYQFGSGGWFAMIPTYALYKLRHTPLRCASPYEVFDPAFAMTAAYQFARGLSLRSNYRGTVESLRAGWWWPAKMGSPSEYAVKIAKWKRHLRAVGLPESFLKQKGPAFPKRDPVAMYRAMGGRLL